MGKRLSKVAWLGVFPMLVWGCGGGGTQSQPSFQPAVVRLALPSNAVTGYAYNVVGSVALGSISVTSSSSFGGYRDLGAYWPTPAKCVSIPTLDSAAYSESLRTISPDGTQVAGSTIDVQQSGGPGRGFVYNLKTGKFHILKLAGVYPTVTVFPQSMDASGMVRGEVDNESGGGGKQFVYNLATDTYTLSNIPDYSGQLPPPPGGEQVSVRGYSANLAYAVGSCVLGSQTRAVVWNVPAKTSTIIGPPSLGTEANAVSDDGSEVIYTVNGPVSPTKGYYLWTASHGSQSLLSLVQQAGLGSDWAWANWVSLSADGTTLCTTGDVQYGSQASLSYPVLIRLK